MGYEVFVHRADDWSGAAERPILAGEWLALVESHPELTRGPGGDPFDFDDGKLVAKTLDRATLAKLLAIAAKLGARVQGEEGEFYEYAHDVPDDAEMAALLRGRALGVRLAYLALAAFVVVGVARRLGIF